AKKNDFIAERGFPLSFKELFSLCKEYRKIKSIDANDFVILLTKRRNSLNWFSAFEDKNCFVHTGDWEFISDIESKYPIAYQVIENVMASLMEVNIAMIPNKFIHHPSIGCMNDFCQYKQQILLKLKTADICRTCSEEILRKGVELPVIMQVLDIFEGIREEFLFKKYLYQNQNPSRLVISKDVKITLPDLNGLEIRLTPLFKTLYLFFLNHPEGVKVKDLVDFRKELTETYMMLSPKLNIKKAEKNIDDLVNPFSNSFSEKKAKINRIIINLLGKELSSLYLIDGNPGDVFKINISKELIENQLVI
ncbi:MAG: hypothetical protein LC134_08720, partial [Chitinophagales bacterium]|nr:hypothetical protein [Chitinophagales bacterium]